MRRECLLSPLLAYLLSVSLIYAVPPISHVPLDTLGIPPITGEAQAQGGTISPFNTSNIPTSMGEAGQELEAPEDIIFDASAMDSTFKPSRDWPQKVTCYAVFNPYLLGLKRAYVYDAIMDDYTLYVYNKSPKRLGVSSGNFPFVFDGEITVKLEGEKFTSIPSVAPDAEIISYEVSPAVKIDFYKDGADNFYVKPYLTPGNSVTVKIKLKMGADEGYFSSDIPEHLTLEDIPAELRRPVPENVKAKAQLLVERLGLKNEKNLRKILGTLTAYFSTFSCDSVPSPQKEPDVYLAIAESRQGACSQRAVGFFITANSLGIPTRLVINECHAFVEVYIPQHGWKMINLNGCGEAQAKNIAGKEPFEGVAKDSDADWLSDFYEEWVTSTDPNNPDTDGDGIPDWKEDLDGDGLSNYEERSLCTDPRKPEEGSSFGEKAEFTSIDSDSDKLSDSFEEQFTYTNPYNPDTDGDGVADGEEDLDSDGLTNAEEQILGLNPLNPDTDGDGLSDSYERGILKTDPNSRDTDMDGTPDGNEDPDGDGLTNLEEQEVGTNPRNPDTDRDGVLDGVDSEPVGKDSDNDGLSDNFESLTKTNPSTADSDGDGTPDGDEDLDGDGLSNLAEQMLGTNPAKRDTDSDGLSDAFEVMLAGTDPNVADTDSNGAPDKAEYLDKSNIDEQTLGLNSQNSDAKQEDEGDAEQQKEAPADENVSISLNLSSISIKLGEEVAAMGRLSSGDKGLAGREVDILINGTRVISVVTGEDGYYDVTLNFSAPGSYAVKAVFESGNLPYKSAESTTFVVDVADVASGRNYAAVIIGAASLLAGVAGGVVYYTRFRAKPAPTAQKSKSEKKHAFAEMKDDYDVTQKGDYRSRVIIAYNRLLLLLSTKGLNKEPNQTHWEFCRRVLGELPEIGEGLSRITALYERAFYSTHPVEESHYLVVKTEMERVKNVLSGGEIRENT